MKIYWRHISDRLNLQTLIKEHYIAVDTAHIMTRKSGNAELVLPRFNFFRCEDDRKLWSECTFCSVRHSGFFFLSKGPKNYA